jgi:hypothetical protein
VTFCRLFIEASASYSDELAAVVGECEVKLAYGDGGSGVQRQSSKGSRHEDEGEGGGGHEVTRRV